MEIPKRWLIIGVLLLVAAVVLAALGLRELAALVLAGALGSAKKGHGANVDARQVQRDHNERMRMERERAARAQTEEHKAISEAEIRAKSQPPDDGLTAEERAERLKAAAGRWGG